MKLVVQVLVALLALIVAFWAVSAVLGYLVGAVVLVLAALGVAGLARMWLVGREDRRGPDLSNVRRAEKEAEKRLRQMEREANTNRIGR